MSIDVVWAALAVATLDGSIHQSEEVLNHTVLLTKVCLGPLALLMSSRHLVEALEEVRTYIAACRRCKRCLRDRLLAWGQAPFLAALVLSSALFYAIYGFKLIFLPT